MPPSFPLTKRSAWRLRVLARPFPLCVSAVIRTSGIGFRARNRGSGLEARSGPTDIGLQISCSSFVIVIVLVIEARGSRFGAQGSLPTLNHPLSTINGFRTCEPANLRTFQPSNLRTVRFRSRSRLRITITNHEHEPSTLNPQPSTFFVSSVPVVNLPRRLAGSIPPAPRLSIDPKSALRLGVFARPPPSARAVRWTSDIGNWITGIWFPGWMKIAGTISRVLLFDLEYQFAGNCRQRFPGIVDKI